jgi:transposase
LAICLEFHIRTPTIRNQYSRSATRYQINLTDEEWRIIEPFPPPAKATDRPCILAAHGTRAEAAADSGQTAGAQRGSPTPPAAHRQHPLPRSRSLLPTPRPWPPRGWL